MSSYVFVYLGSALLALVTTPVVIRLARRLNFVAVPNARHVHTRPIAHIGGVALFVSTVAVTLPVVCSWKVTGPMWPQQLALFAGAGLIFAVGLVDDLRRGGLRARDKLVAQLVSAAIVCSAGIRIRTLVVPDLLSLEFGWLSWPLTILWIVGIVNAVNLCDGLDGLAAGISAVTCGVIAVFALYSGTTVMAVLMLGLLGSLTGFLFFNFNPAKIFMGDCGSMFLGFTLASSSVVCSMKSPVLVGLALPALALGIPIFDTFFSILRRFLERRSIFAADRGHFHHRLIDMGLTQRHAVLIVYALTVVCAGLGMFLLVTRNGHSLTVLGCLVLLLLLVFHVVGAVCFRDMIGALRRRRAVGHRKQQETRCFEDVQLVFRRAATFNDWWQAVSTAADKMDFWRLELPLVNRQGTRRTLRWQRNGDTPKPPEDELLQVHIPFRDRRSGSSLHMEVKVWGNGSLESAGRRIALFARLIEEHRISDLHDRKGLTSSAQSSEQSWTSRFWRSQSPS